MEMATPPVVMKMTVDEDRDDCGKTKGRMVNIGFTPVMRATKNGGTEVLESHNELFSAQKNASGVPQWFLDAKEKETRKKKVEIDRIASEVRNKKEKKGRELEQEKTKKRGPLGICAAAYSAILKYRRYAGFTTCAIWFPILLK